MLATHDADSGAQRLSSAAFEARAILRQQNGLRVKRPLQRIVMWLLNSGTFLQVVPGTEQLNIFDFQRRAALGIRQDVIEVQFVG